MVARNAGDRAHNSIRPHQTWLFADEGLLKRLHINLRLIRRLSKPKLKQSLNRCLRLETVLTLPQSNIQLQCLLAQLQIAAYVLMRPLIAHGFQDPRLLPCRTTDSKRYVKNLATRASRDLASGQPGCSSPYRHFLAHP